MGLTDTERLDWCERIAAEHPILERHGLVPMTRAAIDAAIREEFDDTLRSLVADAQIAMREEDSK
jgi:hypothetical protein